ncbi:MAG: hypothetical protein Kow00120_13740 [Anaerolineae bacterium]
MFGDRNEKRKQWDVGVGAALVHEGAVLLVRQTYGPAKGKWVLPGGFANHDELLDEAAVRELREETGVEGAPLGVIGVRTRYRPDGGAVYVVFKMRLVRGAPQADDFEVDAAQYFTEDELKALPNIAESMRQSALAALRADGPGLVETHCEGQSGPDYRLYALV